MPREKITTYHQTYPSDLATIDALELEGLQPAEGQTVAALFTLRIQESERLTGLYRRSDAVSRQVKKKV